MTKRLRKFVLAAIGITISSVLLLIFTRQDSAAAAFDDLLEEIGNKSNPDMNAIRLAGTNCVPHLFRAIDGVRPYWRGIRFIPGEQKRFDRKTARARGALLAFHTLGRDACYFAMPDLQRIAAGPEPAAGYAKSVLTYLGFPQQAVQP